MYTVPSGLSAGVATTAAVVRYCHVFTPVIGCTQATYQSLLPMYTHGFSTEMTGDDTIVPPNTTEYRNVNADPVGAVTDATLVCWRSRPSCPQACTSGLGVTEGVTENVGVTVCVADVVGVTDTVTDVVAVTVTDVVDVLDSVPDVVAVTEVVAETVFVIDAEGVTDAVGDGLARVNAYM